jgi:hypothetical protein
MLQEHAIFQMVSRALCTEHQCLQERLLAFITGCGVKLSLCLHPCHVASFKVIIRAAIDRVHAIGSRRRLLPVLLAKRTSWPNSLA